MNHSAIEFFLLDSVRLLAKEVCNPFFFQKTEFKESRKIPETKEKQSNQILPDSVVPSAGEEGNCIPAMLSPSSPWW